MSKVNKVIVVAGARPNFMKIAPIMRAFESIAPQIACILVHTGQHYDQAMSTVFFEELGIREPHHRLAVGSGSHAQQTAKIMMAFETVCEEESPDLVLVVGDVNSTLACSLVAKKMNIVVAHIEAGLRSGDREMPEEINRLATDAITDLFFVTEPEAKTNLLNEGVPVEKIHEVGHVMIDNLLYQVAKMDQAWVGSEQILLDRLPEKYIFLTMHRPSNVDDKTILTKLINSLKRISTNMPIVFLCHPRTRKNLEKFDLLNDLRQKNDNGAMDSGIWLHEPMGYMDALSIWRNSALVITDSGGLQEETTALKVPCLTVRENTERPVTISVGSNELVGLDIKRLEQLAGKIIQGQCKESAIPKLWDGVSGERIVKIIAAL